ncbi:MAG: ion channel [Pseudomonadota bacterium]
MFDQIALGFFLTCLTMAASAGIWFCAEQILVALGPWARRPPHGRKLLAFLMISLTSTIFMLMSAVMIWAIAFWVLGLFATFEAAVYFSLVAFTTLGFGDVLLDQEWRLLSGLSAANGLLLFGLMTAILVETVRSTRLGQRET